MQAHVAHLFHVYLLSDSSDPSIIAAETSRFEPFIAKWSDTIPVTYRRRLVNTAFKAGNIREFCDRWGHNHTFALTLDADSFIPARGRVASFADHAGKPDTRHSANASLSECRR